LPKTHENVRNYVVSALVGNKEIVHGACGLEVVSRQRETKVVESSVTMHGRSVISKYYPYPSKKLSIYLLISLPSLFSHTQISLRLAVSVLSMPTALINK
jgi:uncharacterized protein (DUF362 family)